MGFDRSMIRAGHDDRVCAYPSMMAVLDYGGTPEYTLCCIVTDKERSAASARRHGFHYLENTVAELYACTADYCELAVRRCLRNSRMLSSDVSAGYDPNFASAFEKKNSAFLGRGICFNKFTGSRGKSGSNDANPEFMASLRKIMDDAGVAFQT
ncbi:MAG: aminopeptidase, partial [Christensenellales bacterium]